MAALKITQKQELFAQAVASGMTQADAYRSAFNVRAGTKPSSVQVSASKLMADPNIVQRVSELRAPIAQKAQITLESHLEALKDLRDRAVDSGQLSAAISAEIARGKASGVHVEKTQNEISGKLITKIERVIVDK